METVKRSINTRHFFCKIMEKWIIILIGVIIGCIAGRSYAISKNKAEDEAYKISQEEEIPEMVMTEITVTEEELANIYSMTSLYDSIQAQKDYSKQSIWMKCKDLKKGVAKGTYRIQAETDLEKSQIATLYTDILANNETYNDIAMQEEMRVEYVREGIGYSIPAGGILRIEITSYSKEKAQEWLKEIEKVLKLKKEELEKETGILFSIEKVYKSTLEVFDVGLADRQRTCMTTITTLQTNYDTLVAEMPVNQQEYLTYHLQSRNNPDYVPGQSFEKEMEIVEELSEEELAAMEQTEEEEEEIPMTEEEREELYQKRLKTDTILGGILGAFAVCLFFILKYMYSPILVNTEELNMMYGLSILGETEKSNKGKQKKKNNSNDIKNDIEEYKKIIARISIQDMRGEKIYVTGTQVSEPCMELLEKEGKEQNILFVLGKNFIKESEALIELKDYESVLFMEKEGTSRYADIEEEVKVCKENNKKIVGVVMV